MTTFFTIFHVLVCAFMTFIILLQPGKEDGMGAAFGGGGAASAAFGGRGAVTFLSKVTAVCAVIFFLTSVGLSFVGVKGSIAAGPDEVPAAAAPLSPGATAPSKNAQPAGSTANPANVKVAPSAPAPTRAAPAAKAPAPAQPTKK